MIIPIKSIILENEDSGKTDSSTKSSFIKNAKTALKHPKYQKLLATNLASSAVGGVIGSVGGAALLKTIKPLTEDLENPFPGSIPNGSIPDAQKPPIPPRENILKSKMSQDLNFLKSIGRGAYGIGRGTILYPYKAGKFISKHTPEMVGSAIRLGGLGYLGYAGLKALNEATHANHPTLDKNKPENKINRMLLKDDITSSRTQRDISRSNAKKYEELGEKISKPIINQTINLPLKQADSIVSDAKNPFINKSRLENNRANYYDNLARVISITNDYNKFSKENDPVRIAKGIKKTHSDMINLSEFKPRHISSAK